MRRMIVGAAVLLLTGIAGVAPAAAKLTGPAGALHGCVAKSGTMRVIAYTAKCPRHTTSVILGAQGPAGTPADTTEVSDLMSEVTTLQSQVAALQTLLAGVSRSGHALVLSGMNLQVESGAGGTTAAVNGLGNLIIGYNENPGTQTGSANLVLGDGQSFTSYGGIVAGQGNMIAAPFASVTGGSGNDAQSAQSAIVGGHANSTSGMMAVVAGGQSNQANGTYAFVGGGCANVAGGSSGLFCTSSDGANPGVGSAAILGGEGNIAGPTSSLSGFATTVVGGDVNNALAPASSILGGENQTTSTNCQAIPASSGSC